MPEGNNQHHEAHHSRPDNGGSNHGRSDHRSAGSAGDRKGGYRGDRKGSGYKGSHGGDRKGGYKGSRDGDHRGGYKGSASHGKGGYKRDDRRGGYGSRSGASHKPFDNEDANGNRKPYANGGDRDRKPYGKSDRDRKPYSKNDRGDRKPYGKGERKPYGDRPSRDGKRDFKPRDSRDFKRDDRGSKGSFDRKRAFDGDKRDFHASDAPAREGEYSHEQAERPERKTFERRGPWRPNAQNAELAERHPQEAGVYRGELELDENGDYKYRNRPRGNGGDNRRGAKRSFGDAPRTSGVPHRDGARSASPARLAALQVCRIVRERDAFAQELIHKYIDSSRMSREDRAFATRLVLGVVSSTGTLDDVINRCLDRISDIDDDVRDAMRVSTYEIVFLGKEPHAAVSQGVELVRSVAPKAAGLANAVLRRISDKKHKFPFGDPRTDFAAYARLHAFPEWLAKRAIKDLGPEIARDYLAASNEPAPLFIALNAIKAEEEEVLETIRASHGDPTPVVMGEGEIPGCFCLSEGRVLFDGRVRHLISQGMLLVSDASSQQVARLVLPEEKPASFLEIGAGRGTKTILIQSNAERAWGSQIEDYVTVDNLGFKTELTAERAQTYGVNVAESLTGDATDLDAVVGARVFDAVFIDAPCSGLGTLRRHPEIRWRLEEERIDELAETGLSMLKSAASHVREGGELVFATCTITRAENIDVVKAFLASEEGAPFKLAPMGGAPCFNPALKPGGPDAHFAVKLVKSADASDDGVLTQAEAEIAEEGEQAEAADSAATVEAAEPAVTAEATEAPEAAIDEAPATPEA